MLEHGYWWEDRMNTRLRLFEAALDARVARVLEARRRTRSADHDGAYRRHEWYLHVSGTGHGRLPHTSRIADPPRRW